MATNLTKENRANNQHQVDIILATYNGEKYLAEFIESLLCQSYQNWLLLISDDGSTDETLSIINTYSAKETRISLVNSERQGGVVQNFAKCLTYSSSPYIMFADQDDVWLPEKIALSLQVILNAEQQEGAKCPILAFTDLKLVDENLNVISDSFYKFNKLNPLNNTQMDYLLWRSTVFGCSVIFNKSLKEIVGNIDKRVMMHDHIFALVASIYGAVVYLDKPTVLYRQHATNVIGGEKKNILYKINNIKYYIDTLMTYRTKIEKQLDFLQEKLLKIHYSSNDEKLESYKLKILNTKFSNLHSRLSFGFNYILPYYAEKKISTALLFILIILA